MSQHSGLLGPTVAGTDRDDPGNAARSSGRCWGEHGAVLRHIRAPPGGAPLLRELGLLSLEVSPIVILLGAKLESCEEKPEHFWPPSLTPSVSFKAHKAMVVRAGWGFPKHGDIRNMHC